MIRKVGTLVALAMLGMFALAAQAAASVASFQKVSGRPTLVLQAKKNEANTVYLTQTHAGEIELRETGDNLDYSDIEMTYSPDSLPGCEFTQEFNSPGNGLVTCPSAGVKRILLLLGDKDDFVQSGESFSDKNKPKIPVFARGGKGNDNLIGGLGNDYLFGEAGRDIIEGGKGNDKISGGAGSDAISGEEQYTNDRPPARGGNDLLLGGPARDYIYPGSGRDRVGAGGGNDIVSSVTDRDRDLVDCGVGRNDSLLGVDHRGVRFAEKGINGCETVGSGTFGTVTWSCGKRWCVANRIPFAAREE